ncbi:MAG: hypothetical protein L3J54_13450 [Draconibacterium sp.]|nr:hypothetical protein [Draconibacterium sp.]
MLSVENHSQKTYARLIIALLILITSFVVMTYGSIQGENIAEVEQVSVGARTDKFFSIDGNYLIYFDFILKLQQ